MDIAQPTIEELRTTLDRVQEWIRATDQKIGILAAVQAVICAFLLPEIGDWTRKPETSALLVVGLLAAGGGLGLGVIWSVVALFPDMKSRKRSATFFGSIAPWPEDAYSEYLHQLTDADWRREYIHQIHICSRIALSKSEVVRRAAWLFIAGVAGVFSCYLAALAGF